jgi:hypothetical protein
VNSLDRVVERGAWIVQRDRARSALHLLQVLDSLATQLIQQRRRRERLPMHVERGCSASS